MHDQAPVLLELIWNHPQPERNESFVHDLLIRIVENGCRINQPDSPDSALQIDEQDGKENCRKLVFKRSRPFS
jgi:hypothetical protein